MKQTMGEKIAEFRKAKNMTQKELAERMNVTDKAVSKWERNLTCPDVHSLPRLAEVLESSMDELLQVSREKLEWEKILGLVLKAVPLAMGVAVVVTSVLGTLEFESVVNMLGIGLICLALDGLKK